MRDVKGIDQLYYYPHYASISLFPLGLIYPFYLYLSIIRIKLHEYVHVKNVSPPPPPPLYEKPAMFLSKMTIFLYKYSLRYSFIPSNISVSLYSVTSAMFIHQ